MRSQMQEGINRQKKTTIRNFQSITRTRFLLFKALTIAFATFSLFISKG